MLNSLVLLLPLIQRIQAALRRGPRANPSEAPTPIWSLTIPVWVLTAACGGAEPKQWVCGVDGADAPDFVEQIGCEADFALLASEPLSASIPGARSVKTAVDRDSDGALTFQNSVRYPIHWEFLSEHRSAAQGFPRVVSLSEFNRSEYYSSSRRFVLGSLTHYEGPNRWTYEVSPYDTADAAMIRDAFERVAANSFMGGELYFHPTSLNVESVAAELPDDVRIITTDQIFEGVEFQALNVAESIGRLRILRASELETAYVSFEDIVVLDNVPNDISVTRGIITSEFQTPLSHINVLSQNRGTPNMALRNAVTDPQLVELEGEWVRLRVGLTDYDVERVDQAEADAWWEANRPDAVQVPGADLGVTELRNVGEIIAQSAAPDQFLALIKEATRAFGGKAANYAALAHVPGLRVPPAFAIPIYYFRQFMQENGFDERVGVWVDDPSLPFWNDPALRDAELELLRDDMRIAPVNPDFERLLMEKLATDYPGVRMRFRSSTNAEDLDGFTGAGLYTSRSGEPDDPTSPVLDAVRRVWSSVWSFRAFEERRYRSIDHQAVGMALLVHRSFPEEEANGVALTNNPFDRAGLEPAFYVNVQAGEFSVVQPEPGTTTDEFLHYFDLQGQPVSYLSQSNKVAAGERVLSPEQVQELGLALDGIRSYFRPAYAPELGAQNQWWAMDVEFKFDAEAGEAPVLFVKQARPFGKR